MLPVDSEVTVLGVRLDHGHGSSVLVAEQKMDFVVPQLTRGFVLRQKKRHLICAFQGGKIQIL